MVKKYILVRVPVEAMKGFRLKKAKMENTVKVYTGKVVKIPMTKVLTAVANSPTEIHEQRIVKLVKRKVRRAKL